MAASGARARPKPPAAKAPSKSERRRAEIVRAATALFDRQGYANTSLDDIAREINPMVRGWIAYYGRYTRSALYPLARYINQTLAVWMPVKL